MALIREGLLNLVWKPCVNSVRYGRRVNVQRPRAPHYERARVLALLEPQYKKEESLSLPPSATCKKNEETTRFKIRPDNPLEKILAREMRQKFEECSLVGFIHCNPINGYDLFEANLKFKREKMEYDPISKHTAQIALKDSNYETALKLFVSHTSVVYSKEANVDKLIKIVNKIPQFVLMAAMVDGKLLSVTQLKAYAKLKDVTTARAQLVGTLNLAGSQLMSKLSQQQTILVHQLDELAKLKGGGEE